VSKKMRDNPEGARAIAEFLKAGGKVKTFESPITVSVEEVIAYLATCGVEVKRAVGEKNPYLFNRKRYGAEGLARIANEFRVKAGLRVFAVTLSPGSRRRSK
jgi:hypothetical protein